MSTVVMEARAHLADVFDDMPERLSDDEVREAVERHYDGGWAGFIRDGLA